MSILKRTLIFLFGAFILFSVGNFAYAQGADSLKYYYYKLIDVSLFVNSDSSVNVTEKQTFSYQGNFHKGWRSINLDGIGEVSDVSIVDGTTGKALEYSYSKLSPEDSSSWGKFTHYKSSGDEGVYQNIEWYYNLSDTDHDWIIRYKIADSVSFYDNYDRLYLDIFSDSAYNVPIDQVDVSVYFPGHTLDQNYQALYYRSFGKNGDFTLNQNSNTLVSKASNFSSKEFLTVDVKFPKGIVVEIFRPKASLGDLWGIFASIAISIICLIIGFFYWLFQEKFKKGKGVIIPQYEPPKGIKPAMAEFVIKESVGPKGISATIVDLIVRKYIEIEEMPVKKSKMLLLKIFVGIIPLAVLASFLVSVLLSDAGSVFFGLWPFFAIIIVISLAKIFFSFGKNFSKTRKSFKMILIKDYQNDLHLNHYEKKLLDTIFSENNSLMFGWGIPFSESAKFRKMYSGILEFKKEVGEELEKISGIYTASPSKEYRWKVRVFLSYILATGIFIFGSFFSVFVGGVEYSHQMVMFWAYGFAAIYSLRSFIKYETRLSHEGNILKEHLLGFKYFLETVEGRRIQDLTPEMFQTFFPYAVVFGIESKWTNHFSSLFIQDQQLSGGYINPSIAVGLSSSLSSAFNVGATGGGSGGFGGGGAGGGGGGGGGGAS
ncbi:MAG: DUF2207 domain-containing protein [Candidatus Paceibacterota bacterium]|jgi:uncharacterized membrane protein YgcG